MTFNIENILMIVSLIFMLIYQFSIFTYASSILVKSSRNNLLFLALSIINTTFFALYQMSNLPFYSLISCFLVILIIEFKLISKTDFIQIFCGASIFVLHISAFLTPLTTTFSHFTKISPQQILNGSVYESIIVIVSTFFFFSAQEVVKKYIDSVSIQRVTVKSKYSILLFISILLVVLFQIAHAALIVTYEIYNAQLFLSMVTSLASLLLFYLFFLYSIRLVNSSLYKRYSDNAISEQEKILKQKSDLQRKVERDDLTGAYNRKYILHLLEKMCEEESLFYVLFIDINALKYTNDNFGHTAGDRLITKISDSITSAVRAEDSVARIGGDEFLVIIGDLHQADFGNLIERIRHNIDVQNETEEFLVSASIGYVFVDSEIREKGSSHILSLADENMRKNKELFYEKRKENV